MTLPAAYATLPSQHRLAFWSRLFDLGKVQVPALVVASSLPLALSAYLVVPVRSLGFVGAHRREILGAAAALALSIVPYTVLVMFPGINRLKDLEQRCAYLFRCNWDTVLTTASQRRERANRRSWINRSTRISGAGTRSTVSASRRSLRPLLSPLLSS